MTSSYLNVGGACSTYGEKRVLVGKLAVKTPLGISKRTWMDNIKMDGITWN